MKRIGGMMAVVVVLGSVWVGLGRAAESAAPRLPWLSAQGARLVDEKGRVVVLKGLFLHNNTWGNWVWPESDRLQREGKDPMIKPTVQDAWVLTERDFEILAGLELNHVVYDVNHELFLPENPKRLSNLDLLEIHVKRFNSMGVYVVVNFAGSPGLNVNSAGGERDKAGDVRLKTIFEDTRYQDMHLEFIETVVGRLKGYPGVGGYILTDEPFCPSDTDGGEEAFRRAYNRFARGIRALDGRHLIIAQGYNARESNPGESYWDGATKSFKVDGGEQAIQYERKIVRLDPSIKNVAYDIHIFDPWTFVSEGAKDFDEAAIEKTLAGYVKQVNGEFNAPLFISSYGVNRKQETVGRVRWLNVYHKLFDRYGVSAAYFCYKDNVNPFGGNDFMGVFGHYVDMDRHLRFGNGTYEFVDSRAGEMARGPFTKVLERYFIQEGKPNPIACMDADFLAAFQRYWGR